MVTIFKSHPAESDWQIDVLGMSDLAYNGVKDDETPDEAAARMTVFNILQILMVSNYDLMEEMSSAFVRHMDTTTRINNIDDRAWTLLCSMMDGFKLVANVYPEYVTVKEQD